MPPTTPPEPPEVLTPEALTPEALTPEAPPHFLHPRASAVSQVLQAPLCSPPPAPVVKPGRLRMLIVNWRCPENPRAGGAEIHLHAIASRLAQMGAVVTVLTSGWRGGAKRSLIDGVQYRRVGSDGSFLWQHRSTLGELCRTNTYDLVIDDISKIPLGIHRWTRTATLAWCHHIHGAMLYRQLPRPLARCLIYQERRIPRLYQGVPILAVSRSTRDELAAMGHPPQRLGYIHNGVDARHIRDYAHERSATPLLIYLGRLQRYKNVDCVLRAFARIRGVRTDAQLLILGTGEDEKRLRRLAARYGTPGVTFRGRVSEAEKFEMLHRAWLLLASSMKEGWGICILEAAAAGTPVIASDVPGHRDAVIHEHTGLLYPYDDDAALAASVLRYLAAPQTQRTMTHACRRWAQRFSWERSAQELLMWAVRFFPDLRSTLIPLFEHDSDLASPTTSGHEQDVRGAQHGAVPLKQAT